METLKNGLSCEEVKNNFEQHRPLFEKIMMELMFSVDKKKGEYTNSQTYWLWGGYCMRIKLEASDE